ncbi:hypothetical protein CCR75_009083 [Bremia lactucae]|uniref:Secreted protein n=1 Tax=Bremia lactucae TaxID=4779 RepID=A0A976IKP3_BRELC|nr:hypothetical protein CCR75_009083 [Bremia lactucae]
MLDSLIACLFAISSSWPLSSLLDAFFVCLLDDRRFDLVHRLVPVPHFFRVDLSQFRANDLLQSLRDEQRCWGFDQIGTRIDSVDPSCRPPTPSRDIGSDY